MQVEKWYLYPEWEVLRETQKALLVRLGDREEWLPKSVVLLKDDFLAVPEWFKEKKSLNAPSLFVEARPQDLKNEKELKRLLDLVKKIGEGYTATWRYCRTVLALPQVLAFSPELREEVGPSREFIVLKFTV